MNARRPALSVELLDERALPTTFGIPWADSSHLTLSFVPDGTATPYGPSTLSTTMPAGYQREILRAFQTWAQYANIDVSLVADGGQPLGTPGAVQSDPRFGDIRIAAAPEAPSLVASAAPFSFSGTTLSGDVVFNSSMPFRIGNVAGAYDVFSTALHEAAHVYGFDHSTDPASAVNETYGYRTGPSTTDIANLRALYGARTPDRFDANGTNNSMGTADALPSDALLANRLSATGDLTTKADVDFYKFSVPLLLGVTGVSVRLQAAGLSLLAPSLTIYDKSGRVVASASSTDPTHNDLSLRFTPGLFGGTYYVKVDGATADVFAMGGYRLAVDYLTLGTILAPLAPILSPILDLHTDDTLGLARLLSPLSKPAPDARFDYTFQGVIEDSRDIDRYKVHAPSTGPVNLNVMVWALQTNGLDPRLQVYNATTGQPVAFQVLANDAGLMSLQVPNAAPGADYIVSVLARTPGDTGSYFLAIDFNKFTPTEFDGLTSDSLKAGATQSATLTVAEAGVYEFALAAQGASGSMTMTIYDAAGRAVLTLSSYAGQPLMTSTVYLAGGTYTVQYTSQSSAELAYQLFLYRLSDGAGPYATSAGSSPTPPPGGTTTSGGGYTYAGSSTTRPVGSPYYF
ncbi:MAG: matrixin family metalloprotease [Zavarzinella sp.]|nr:matrixin family metalloprotease [Zavarzinella sp.]